MSALPSRCSEIPLPDQSVHCCVTSPPYFGLRVYSDNEQWVGGNDGCHHVLPVENPAFGSTDNLCSKCKALRTVKGIGLEASVEAYVANLVAVFREVWRVLRDDGTVFLNLGDSYGQQTGAGFNANKRLDAASRDTAVGSEHGPGNLLGIPGGW
ncbi:hypothetical protein LCGC14_3123640 [marine sediment metagenome]|uniref:site-specific DNA-methyltransferase (cytosine-N(4)-specific) n=1 Tax=marine sediment metagenome TaxID=412755 RepID=A0A0F8YRD0_9ZZZZ